VLYHLGVVDGSVLIILADHGAHVGSHFASVVIEFENNVLSFGHFDVQVFLVLH
jgi:hypothetical protein